MSHSHKVFNFQLDGTNIKALRDVLTEDIEVLRSWQELKDYFLDNPPDIFEIENMIRRGERVQDVVLRTLTLWIKNMGQLATLDTCINLLRERSFMHAAECLDRKRDFIRQGQIINAELAPVWFNVDRPCHRFTGRVEEIQDLHKMLYKNNREASSPTVESRLAIIAGLGGIGKTTLARAYAQKFKEQYSSIIWIEAESKSSMTKSFKALVKHLRLESDQDQNEQADNLTEKVYTYLGIRNSLLIFDNAEELRGNDGIFNFFPKTSLTPFQNPPYILVTTRRLDLIIDGSILTLDVLKEEDAIEFILKWLKQEQVMEEIIKLVQLLQMLPLALEQAGAYLARQELLRGNRPGGPSLVAQYITLFEENAKVILSKTEFQTMTLSSYDKTTLTTWTNTIQKIRLEFYGKQSIMLLEIMAYLGSDSIPPEFLLNLSKIDLTMSKNVFAAKASLQPNKEELETVKDNVSCFRRLMWSLVQRCFKDEIETKINVNDDDSKENFSVSDVSIAIPYSYSDIDNALDVLKSYSMVTELVSGVSIHRIVQKYVQICTKSVEEKAILYRAIQVFKVTFSDESIFQLTTLEVKCAGHARALFNTLALYDDLLIEFPDFASMVCRRLDHVQSYEDILSLIDIVAPKYTALFGTKSSKSIELQRCKALALRSLKMYNEALAVINEVYPFAVESLGESASSTLDIQNIRGMTLSKMGRKESAIKLFDKVIPLYIELEGPYSLNAVTVLHNKACCLGELKNRREAIQLFRQVYEVRKEILKEDHPFTMTIKYSLGLTLLLELEERAYDTASSRVEIDLQRKEALKLLDEVNRAYENILGKDHRRVIDTTNSRIVALLKTNEDENNKKAEKLCQELLVKQTKHYGAEHGVTLVTRHNLGVALAQQGRKEEAYEIFEEVLVLMKNVMQESDQPLRRCIWWRDKLKSELHIRET